MAKTVDKLASQIRSLPDGDKVRLVDAILTELHKPDPKLDRVWAQEARRRLAAYHSGRVRAVAYADVMAKLRRR